MSLRTDTQTHCGLSFIIAGEKGRICKVLEKKIEPLNQKDKCVTVERRAHWAIIWNSQIFPPNITQKAMDINIWDLAEKTETEEAVKEIRLNWEKPKIDISEKIITQIRNVKQSDVLF